MYERQKAKNLALSRLRWVSQLARVDFWTVRRGC
jgi:hypothetical protein